MSAQYKIVNGPSYEEISRLVFGEETVGDFYAHFELEDGAIWDVYVTGVMKPVEGQTGNYYSDRCAKMWTLIGEYQIVSGRTLADRRFTDWKSYPDLVIWYDFEKRFGGLYLPDIEPYRHDWRVGRIAA
jgi:hypothetical protein